MKGTPLVEVRGKKTVHDFIRDYPDSSKSLSAWLAEAARAKWANPNQVKQQYRNATIIDGRTIVFNIAGNKYRMEIKANFQMQELFVKRIGTHQEYDEWEY